MSDESLLSTYFGILPQMPENTILRLLLETAIQIFDADEASLLVYEEKSKSLRFALTVGDEESARKLLGQSVPLGQGLTGLAAMTREVQIGAPTFHDVKQTQKRDTSEPEAVIAAPMVVGDTLVGVITAVSFQAGKRFSMSHAKLYSRYGTIAALIVDQRRRLAAVENKDDAALSSPALSEAARREQEIVAAIRKIVRSDEGALPHVAQIVTSIEALVRRAGGH